MTGRGVRLIKVTPVPEVDIKVEVLSEDDDDTVNCRICSKGFASQVALRNHAMMEHFEAFSSGNPQTYTCTKLPKIMTRSPPTAKPKLQDQDLQKIKQNTEKVLSSMKTGTLTTLASEDVSYIIIKSEEGVVEAPIKKKKVKVVNIEKTTKEAVAKKKKEADAIKGPFECMHEGTCHRIFFSCCEYSIHYRDEHTRRRTGLRCQVCEKSLSSTDDNQFPYTCDVCGTGFNASKELSEHTSTVHVKLKPFQCEVCHKRFTQQGGVQQHMRMHTGDRPFSCSFCPKAFTQKSGLDQHLRIHTKVKPYRCVICSKAFCQSIHLKQHMRTHTNVTPFQCGICHKRFKQSSHLNYHLRNHNPAAMTADQRAKYAELLGLMNREVVEIEVDQVEIPMEQTMVEHMEQVVAEQSIQVVEGEEYVLEDGQESWSVQLVDS